MSETYEEMQNRAKTMTDKEILATRCAECGFCYGAHILSCSHMTVDYMRVLLNASQRREQRNTGSRERLRAQVSLWQSKFNTVRHENNRLRRQLDINALQPTVRERAINALKQLKGFDLNLDTEETKRLYELNVRSLAGDFAAMERKRK